MRAERVAVQKPEGSAETGPLAPLRLGTAAQPLAATALCVHCLVSQHLTKLNIKHSKGYCVPFVPLATEISSALSSP